MNKYKSAQGLSLNTIIIGAIVLVVLMVLVTVFSGFFGNRFTPGFAEATEQRCEGEGYTTTMPECGPTVDFNYEQVYARFAEGAVPAGKVCCKSSCDASGGECVGEVKETDTRIPKGDRGCPEQKSLCIAK